MAYAWEDLGEAEKSSILESIAGGGPPPSPRVVELFWQDRCNIDCFFCSTAEVRAGGFAIPEDRLISLFDEMQDLGVRGVRLSGGGEPLFRNDAARLIEAIGRRGMRITDLTTNGVLLSESTARVLFAAGCDQITVSLNTADRGSYASMMRTAPKNFDRVVENVRQAVRVRNQMRADCPVRLQFLIYRDNFRQIPEMYRLFLESGADHFWLNGLYPVTPMPLMTDEEVGEMLGLYEEVLAKDLFDRLETFSFWERRIEERIAESTRKVFQRAPLWRRAHVKWRQVADRRGRERAAASHLHEFCLIGWYSTTINANGDVVACCILQDRKNAVLGNIHRNTLSEIWHGPAYERFRSELREIMARRGSVQDFGNACVVEEVCARKGACPNRSFYWGDDPPFRRRFHDLVERMPAATDEPFSAAGGSAAQTAPLRLPAYPA
jgi:radical SAM protein with 4Fe4S-binding SPASM domain